MTHTELKAIFLLHGFLTHLKKPPLDEADLEQNPGLPLEVV